MGVEGSPSAQPPPPPHPRPLSGSLFIVAITVLTLPSGVAHCLLVCLFFLKLVNIGAVEELPGRDRQRQDVQWHPLPLSSGNSRLLAPAAFCTALDPTSAFFLSGRGLAFGWQRVCTPMRRAEESGLWQGQEDLYVLLSKSSLKQKVMVPSLPFPVYSAHLPGAASMCSSL